MLGVLAGSSLAQSSSDGDHAQRLKFEIWQRGLPECGAHGCSADSATDLSALQQRWMYTRSMPIARLRGGSDGCAGTACEPDAVDLDQLRAELGPEFGAALERNVRDHEADCEASCMPSPPSPPLMPIYVCNENNFTCSQVPAGTAGGTSEEVCNTTCKEPPKKYKCDETSWQCTEDEAGSFDDMETSRGWYQWQRIYPN